MAFAAPAVRRDRTGIDARAARRLRARSSGRLPRSPGPVFIEVCLDAQGAPVDRADLESAGPRPGRRAAADRPASSQVRELLTRCRAARLLDRRRRLPRRGDRALPHLRAAGVPLMTTWNGDRTASAPTSPSTAGRPNTWGQRSANILLAQADVIVALGTRLGLQQTGFNWQQFAPVARVVQVDDRPGRARQGPPARRLPAHRPTPTTRSCRVLARASRGLCRVARVLPRGPRAAATRRGRPTRPPGLPGRLSPSLLDLAARCASEDVVIPCSSGGANFSVHAGLPARPGS